MNGQRGFSVAEMLTVLVIVGLMMSAIVFSIPLILTGPGEAQSQVDNVESAALALYKMQHDARPSTINGIFACNTQPVIACSVPAPQSPMPTAQAVVILSADGTGQFQLRYGNPNWSGFIVYWLTPNADGSSNELRRAYLPVSIPDPKRLGPSNAVTTLSTVMGFSGYTTVAQDVQSMSAAVDLTNKILDLQLVGGDSQGNKSSLRLAGNSYVRN